MALHRGYLFDKATISLNTTTSLPLSFIALFGLATWHRWPRRYCDTTDYYLVCSSFLMPYQH